MRVFKIPNKYVHDTLRGKQKVTVISTYLPAINPYVGRLANLPVTLACQLFAHSVNYPDSKQHKVRSRSHNLLAFVFLDASYSGVHAMC